jgi:transcriptional regulator GlxA family with amidase domain
MLANLSSCDTKTESFDTVSAKIMIFARSDHLLTCDILVLPETSLMSLAAVIEPMRGANRVAGRELFRWRLVSPDGTTPDSSIGLPIAVTGALSADTEAEVVFALSSFNVDRHGAAVLPRLRRLARRGISLGGVEAGAWLLARAGVLNGRRATTHWEDLDAFAAAHPDVDVRPDRFVVDGLRFTTGGASPALDMMLHLVRARHGYAIALDVGSLFIYDQALPAEEPQAQVSLGRLGWREPRLRQAVGVMEQNLSDTVSVTEVARRAGCSERRLNDLFQDRLGVSPYAYYLTLRLNAGRRLVLESPLLMADIAAEAGFGSASAFARAFRSRFGESPGAARKRADRGVA